jgi:hypothetical protein
MVIIQVKNNNKKRLVKEEGRVLDASKQVRGRPKL